MSNDSRRTRTRLRYVGMGLISGWLGLGCARERAAPTEPSLPSLADASGSSGGAGHPTSVPPPVAPDAATVVEALLGSPQRPQLSSDSAAQQTVLAYLAAAGSVGALTVDHWDPTSGVGDIASFTPNFRVSPGGMYSTVQAAVTAAAAAGSAG